MNFNAILLAVITCFSTLFGGIFAARHKKNIAALGALAAGVLITTSLVDILPQTFTLADSANVNLEDVMGVTVIGFLFLYIISSMISKHVYSQDGEYEEVKHPLGGVFATSELSVHSFIDGLAIGFGLEADIHVGIIIAFAVICHDFTDGLSTVAVMFNSNNSLKNSLRILVLDAIAPVLGAIATLPTATVLLGSTSPLLCRRFPILGSKRPTAASTSEESYHSHSCSMHSRMRTYLHTDIHTNPCYEFLSFRACLAAAVKKFALSRATKSARAFRGFEVMA
jgi:zinc transporter ZupT